ncbi:hypothetical protein Dda_4504 [Drechslerella dactyloides]|uniref:Uncharacterized protein n=1 Tax=Drechslerella dactyloides TaxID=74499 RepID=A0AAD6IX18_DREDA|nr:hypothetical protein Dda_4504 [Drechslerella dactyloides]
MGLGSLRGAAEAKEKKKGDDGETRRGKRHDRDDVYEEGRRRRGEGRQVDATREVGDGGDDDGVTVSE